MDNFCIKISCVFDATLHHSLLWELSPYGSPKAL